MSRASINPRCPYCGVRHDALLTWRCRDRDEEASEEASRG